MQNEELDQALLERLQTYGNSIIEDVKKIESPLINGYKGDGKQFKVATRTRITPELIDGLFSESDMKGGFGGNFDARAELVYLMSEQLFGETWRACVRDFMKTTENCIVADTKNLGDKIGEIDAQYVVLSPEIFASYFQDSPEFKFFDQNYIDSNETRFFMGIEKVGTFRGKTVIIDPYLPFDKGHFFNDDSIRYEYLIGDKLHAPEYGFYANLGFTIVATYSPQAFKSAIVVTDIKRWEMG